VPTQDSKSFPELLRTRGLKSTPQRLYILELLSHASKPLSIAELQKKARGKIDTVTLYRSMETLVEKSLVRPVDLRHGHTDYELVGEEGHHHHLVCERCGTLEELESCPAESIQKKLAQKASRFSMLTDHSLEFFGVCNSCA
jgi:Fur family ferric uptake transcriptional regulator